ncbi:MAG: T9SS type A sorting domain-containing protein [Lewinellaceae bacterium]|nr:T9SS type A sorting domain-containing protein [Lewinellaceae bacterium]
MKQFFTLVLVLSTITMAHAQGKWDPLTPLPPGPRERAFHFTFGDKLYVGLGRSHRGYSDISINEKDVWSYDFATDTWQEHGNFPGTPFRNAASFVIGDTAYIVTGHDGSDYVDFFWKYHPATDTWEELPPFPGGVQSFPVAFTINDKGYVTLGGIGSDQPDNTVYHTYLLEYDPATGSWTERSDFPGEGRWRAFSFVIDGKAYVGGGSRERESGLLFSDTYRYDPVTDSWAEVARFPEGWGLGCFSFSLEGRGYVGEGARSLYDENYRTKVWEYDPAVDAWAHISNMPGSQQGRILAYSGVHNGKAYVGGGRNYSDYTLYDPFFDDFYVWNKDDPAEMPAYSNWQSVGRGEADTTQLGIFSIAAVSEDTIWALPTVALTAPQAPLEIMRTTDGGNEWVTATIDPERSFYRASIFARNGREAWVMGTQGMGAFFDGQAAVYHTTDGGQSWELKLDFMDNIIEEGIGIHFFDQNTGLCWGNNWSDSYLVIYRTADGGATWEMVDSPNLPEPGSWLAGYSPSGNNMYDAVGDTIWIPADIQVLRSTDRGVTWTATESFPSSSYSLAFEDAQHGMLTSDNFFNMLRSRAYVTEDGGATWAEVDIPETPLAVSIEHIPGSPGAYVAHSTMFPSPKMVYTPNFGQEWFIVEAPPTMHTLQFLSRDVGFGGGPILRDHEVGVYRWQGDFEEIMTSTEPARVNPEARYQVFPNPVVSSVTVHNPGGFLISSVSVLDSRGRTVLNKVVGHRQESVEVMLQDLPSGFYIIRIQDENGQQAGRILKK